MTVSSATGYGDVGAIEAVIAGSFSAANACYVRYDRAFNRLWLVNDAGTQFTGPATLGVAGSLSNSQCSVDMAGATAAVGNGTTLTLTVPLTFTAGFAGSRNVYLWAASMGGLASGYTQVGTWTVP